MRPRRRRPSTPGDIPLCRSDLLQDVTIALGPRLKSVRYHHSSLTFTVSQDASAGDIERLDIEATEILGTRKKIVLWADGIAWFWHAAPHAPAFECHAAFARIPPDGISRILRASLMDFTSAKPRWQQHPAPAGGAT